MIASSKSCFLMIIFMLLKNKFYNKKFTLTYCNIIMCVDKVLLIEDKISLDIYTTAFQMVSLIITISEITL